MGWITVVAFSLIAVMFVYNWFNKDNSSPTPSQTPEEKSASPSIVKYDNDTVADTERAKLNIPQPPTIISDSDDESPSSGTKSNSDIMKSSIPTPSISTKISPPPAPPTITPAGTSMAPPPRPKSPPRLKPPTFGYAPAAPRPSGSALRPPPSAASSLRVPVTKVLSNTSMAPSSLMAPPKKASKQVALEPGHSPLDWAALTSNPNNNLRGKDAPDKFIRVTPSMLKAQNGRKGKDSWTVYQGKVYNITPYVPFHPGGKGEILRGAGKDSAKLFMEVHPWVNWDGMLAECCVGILVGEEEVGKGNKLDDMD